MQGSINSTFNSVASNNVPEPPTKDNAEDNKKTEKKQNNTERKGLIPPYQYKPQEDVKTSQPNSVKEGISAKKANSESTQSTVEDVKNNGQDITKKSLPSKPVNIATPALPYIPKLDLTKLRQVPKMPNLPSLPELLEKPVEIQAPSQFQHPLIESDQLYFMLGEDSKGKYLYAEGAVIKGAYDKFVKYVNHFESRGIKLDRFMMHSNGGLLNEGLKIGKYVHDNSWTTDADANIQCYSSCGIIYASGVNKRMQTGAKVGFHRPYYPNQPDTPELIIEVYQSYLPYWEYIRGDQKLYDKFMQYKRSDMYVLDAETANNYMQTEIY
ncbi:hypothetical protein VYA_29540 [Vibrio alfacsensis]|nr:hypothetical protein VYA_29540 [Vibrio alfacsensis]